VVGGLAALAAPYGHTGADLALACLLAQPGVTGVIVGARSEAEARALRPVAEWELDPALANAVENLLAAS
jgi:aryl-alcohol dehydrogenase-like predicted oxidoreductase